MKKLFGGLAIASILAMGIGAGLVAGTYSEIEETEAAVSYGGTYFLELAGDWGNQDSQIGLYFMDSSTNFIAWGDLKTPHEGSYLDYSYDHFSSQPCYVIAMRVKAGSTAWGTSSIWSSDDLYGRTDNIDVQDKDSIWLGEYYTDSKYTNFSPYVMDRGFIRGGDYQAWETTEYNIELTNLKVNALGHMEAYGEVNLEKCSFKAQKGTSSTWSQTWSAHNSLSSVLGGTSGNGNIDLAATNTLTIYFDYQTTNLYITTASLAAADEWSEKFLGINDSSDNCSYSKTHWGSAGEGFEDLDPAVQGLFVSATHYDHSVTDDGVLNTYLLLAVQRYDYVLEIYGEDDSNTDALGYSDFMGRVAASKVTPKASGMSYVIELAENRINAIALIVTAIASVSAVAAGGFFLARRKRNEE